MSENSKFGGEKNTGEKQSSLRPWDGLLHLLVPYHFGSVNRNSRGCELKPRWLRPSREAGARVREEGNTN